MMSSSRFPLVALTFFISVFLLIVFVIPGRPAAPLAAPLSGACPQTVFANSGQSLGSTNSLAAAIGALDSGLGSDVVVGNASGGGIWEEVWINAGDGTLTFNSTFGENGDTPGIVLLDADGDGDLDVIPAGAGSILFKNDGAGNLSMGQWLNLGYDDAIAAAELYGDGQSEVVLSGDGSTTPARVYINTGDPFNPYLIGPSLGNSNAVDILIGKLDWDTTNDILIVNRNQGGGEPSQVWLNNNDGTFTAGNSILPSLPEVSAGALGDVNGDGDPDLLLGFDGFGTALEVWLNDGAGNFTLGAPRLDPILVSDLALVDLDGDTDNDVVVGEAGGAAQVWLNNGSGVYCQAQIGVGSNVNGLALGDLNEDGMPDLFTAENGGNQVWLNELSIEDSDLILTLEGDTLIEFEGEYEYTAQLWNNGPIPATNVILTGTLFSEAGYIFEWDSTNPGDCNEITCTLSSIGPGSLVSFRGNVIVDELNAYSYAVLQAGVLSDLPENNLNNNVDTLEIDIIRCECSLTQYSAICTDPLRNPQAEQSRMFFRSGTKAIMNMLAGDIDLILFYRVRDEVLGFTMEGQRIESLYYAHDPELKSLIINHSSVFDAGLNALLYWEPNLQALVDNEGETAVITAGQVAAVTDFLDLIYPLASPGLQQMIDGELARVPAPEDFIGMTMERARSIVVGYEVDLPIMQTSP